MARKRQTAKGRREGGSFVALPHRLLNDPSFTGLSAKALKLLIDVSAQFRGDNNGDLSMAWTQMSQRGWVSRSTLNKARNELLDKGFLVLTRQGGRHMCSLYAITWQAIDDCNGKHDAKPTAAAPGNWKKSTDPTGGPI